MSTEEELYQLHKTQAISIGKKKIHIDIEIVPIIKWLNNFKGITTIASCQGESCYKNTKNGYIYSNKINKTFIKYHTCYVLFCIKNIKCLNIVKQAILDILLKKHYNLLKYINIEEFIYDKTNKQYGLNITNKKARDIFVRLL